jgi:hypothetical protein
VTELAEEIKITIALYPDRVPYQYNKNIDDMRQWVVESIGDIIPMVMRKPNRDGKITVHGAGIEVMWSNTGLQEIPEEGGGDN